MKNIKRLLIFIMAVALTFTMTPLAGTAAQADDGNSDDVIEASSWNDLCKKYGQLTDEENKEMTITIPSGKILEQTGTDTRTYGFSVSSFRYKTDSGATIACDKFIITGGGTIRPKIDCQFGLFKFTGSSQTLTLQNITLDGHLDNSKNNTCIGFDMQAKGNTVNIESGCTIKGWRNNSVNQGAVAQVKGQPWGNAVKNKLNIHGGLITQNTYQKAAVYVDSGGGVEISGGTFSDNTATSDTGAVCLVTSFSQSAYAPEIGISNAVFSGNRITRDSTEELGGDVKFDISFGQTQMNGWQNNTFSHSDSTEEADKYRDVIISYTGGKIVLGAALQGDLYFTCSSHGYNLEGQKMFTGTSGYTLQQSDYEHLKMLEGSLSYPEKEIKYHLKYDSENHAAVITEFPENWTTAKYTVKGLGDQVLSDATFDVVDQTDPESDANVTGRLLNQIGVIPGHDYQVTIKASGYKDGQDTFTAAAAAADNNRTINLEADPLNYTVGSWGALYDAFGDTDEDSGLITIKIPKNTTVKINGTISCPNAPVKFAGGTYQRAEGYSGVMFSAHAVQPVTFKNVTFDGANVAGKAVLYRQVYQGKKTPDDALTTLNGCTFTNVNTSESIVSLQYPASSFKDCTFNNCTVSQGCLSTKAKFSVTNCKFDGIKTPTDAENSVTLFYVNSEGSTSKSEYIFPTEITVSGNTYTDLGDAAQVCFNNHLADRPADYYGRTDDLRDMFIPEISSDWGIDSIILDGYYSKVRLLDAITADQFKVKVIHPSEQYKMIIGSDDYKLTQDDFNKIRRL